MLRKRTIIGQDRIASRKDYCCQDLLIFVQRQIKMIKLLGLVVAMGLMFQSCVTTEEVTVKKEGSISYVLETDFSELLQAMPDANTTSAKVKKALNMINGEELSVERLLDIGLLESQNGVQKKDSILKANPNLLKKTENLRIRIMMNDTIGNIALKVTAKNAEELTASLVNLEALTALDESNTKKIDAPEYMKKSKFEWRKKMFQRTVSVKPEDAQSDLGEMGQMVSMFTYRIKVNFEQPIQSVSYQDALISQDGKSFVKEFKMSEIIANPKVLEYEVKLK